MLEEQKAEPWRESIEQSRLAPERIVLEITEKQAIPDFDLFKRTLLSYYRQGFKAAIDNISTGHDRLRAVTEVRPHIIKIAIALVRDVDRDRAKNALVSAIIHLAKRIESRVLARRHRDARRTGDANRDGRRSGPGLPVGPALDRFHRTQTGDRGLHPRALLDAARRDFRSLASAAMSGLSAPKIGQSPGAIPNVRWLSQRPLGPTIAVNLSVTPYHGKRPACS